MDNNEGGTTMAMSSRAAATATKGHVLNIRVSEEERELLDEASTAEGTTRSAFVLKHATRAAEEVLADRRTFRLPDEQWRAFTAALDAPAQQRPRLAKLLDAPTLLDQA
jgi:uncharacterized protein (DUF1778 family)